jgi:hypothetical protein
MNSRPGDSIWYLHMYIFTQVQEKVQQLYTKLELLYLADMQWNDIFSSNKSSVGLNIGI